MEYVKSLTVHILCQIEFNGIQGEVPFLKPCLYRKASEWFTVPWLTIKGVFFENNISCCPFVWFSGSFYGVMYHSKIDARWEECFCFVKWEKFCKSGRRQGELAHNIDADYLDWFFKRVCTLLSLENLCSPRGMPTCLKTDVLSKPIFNLIVVGLVCFVSWLIIH